MRFRTPDNSNGPFSDFGLTFITAMGWCPQYDASGKILNNDPNYHQSSYTDLSNGKVYTRITQGGLARFFEGSVGYLEFDSGKHFFEESF